MKIKPRHPTAATRLLMTGAKAPPIRKNSQLATFRAVPDFRLVLPTEDQMTVSAIFSAR